MNCVILARTSGRCTSVFFCATLQYLLLASSLRLHAQGWSTNVRPRLKLHQACAQQLVYQAKRPQGISSRIDPNQPQRTQQQEGAAEAAALNTGLPGESTLELDSSADARLTLEEASIDVAEPLSSPRRVAARKKLTVVPVDRTMNLVADPGPVIA
eukprot:SAG31_NODE_13840_length_843_cov_1.090054_1_plen_156_part_00